MSILNITNLTDNPEKWIYDKFDNAFEEVEKELEITINESDKQEFIENQITNLEEYMEDSKGSELLGIIDNYLVNLDYYSEVKEWYKEQQAE